MQGGILCYVIHDTYHDTRSEKSSFYLSMTTSFSISPWLIPKLQTPDPDNPPPPKKPSRIRPLQIHISGTESNGGCWGTRDVEQLKGIRKRGRRGKGWWGGLIL